MFLDGKAHPFQRRLKGEQTLGVPIRQAEQIFMEPDIHLSRYQAACHGNNSIPLCNQRVRADQLFPEAGHLAANPASQANGRPWTQAWLSFSFDHRKKIARLSGFISNFVHQFAHQINAQSPDLAIQ